MPNNITKSYAISDAKIVFVSLVDKAANKREFLITKSEGSKAEFQTYGRIVKADAESHYVTGIVYEPMVEDTDGNYMTEEEITKAAHWFMKNAGDADIQHCFEKAEGVEVVESYVAKSDMEIAGQPIKKGTWLMTMEVTDDAVWESVEKGEITGFSMGGKGAYSEVDVDISDPDNPIEKVGGKKGILKALASMFGMDVVEKSAVKERYKERIVRDNFWTAFYALSEYLFESYNPDTGRYEKVTDETKVREALEDFNAIVTDLLSDKTDDGLLKSIEKAGKKMSSHNRETLKGIHESLGAFLSNFDDDKEEDKDVTKQEVEQIVNEAIEKAMKSKEEEKKKEKNSNGCVSKSEMGFSIENGGETEDIGQLIKAAVEEAASKVFPQEDEEEPTVEDMVQKAVAEAMEPYLKQAGISKQLNGEGVAKSVDEPHYLAGII